jgi:hypothetical protein
MADQDQQPLHANDPVEAPPVPPPRRASGHVLPQGGRGRGRGQGAAKGDGGAGRAAEPAHIGTGQAGGRVYISNFD